MIMPIPMATVGMALGANAIASMSSAPRTRRRTTAQDTTKAIDIPTAEVVTASMTVFTAAVVVRLSEITSLNFSSVNVLSPARLGGLYTSWSEVQSKMRKGSKMLMMKNRANMPAAGHLQR